MVATSKFTIVQATLDDRERIVEFMRRAFFKYEPLNMTLGSSEGPASSRDIRSLASLGEGTSLLAVSEEGTIVGVCLNGEIFPDEPEEPFMCTCRTYAQVLRIVTAVVQRADVWGRTTAKRALDLHVLAVDSASRGQGLGRKLLEQSRALAKEQGYPLLTITCTGAYSAHLPSQMGMQCVYSIPYSELVAEGLLPMEPPEPHTEIKVFIQPLTA